MTKDPPSRLSVSQKTVRWSFEVSPGTPYRHLAPNPQVLRFDVFKLDVRVGELRKRGTKLRLQGQPLQPSALAIW